VAKIRMSQNRSPVVCETLEGRELHSVSPLNTVGQFVGKFAAKAVVAAVVKAGYEKTGHVCPAPWYVPKLGGLTHHLTCYRVAE
jgi:hypothetical protein